MEQPASTINYHLPYLGKILVTVCLMTTGFLIFWNYISIEEQPSVQIETPPASSVFMIGGIAPRTGIYAHLSTPFIDLSKLIETHTNQQNGFGDRFLKIQWEDGRCELVPARQAAEKLIKTNQAQILIGGLCSEEFQGTGPIAQSRKLISYSPTAESTASAALGQFILRSSPTHTHYATAAIKFFTDQLKANKIALISENQPQAQNFQAQLIKQLRNTDLSYTQYMYPEAATDSASLLSNFNSDSVDVAFFIANSVGDSLQALQKFRNQHPQTPILISSALMDRHLHQSNPQLFNDLYGLELNPTTENQSIKELLQKYQQTYGRPPEYPGPMAAFIEFIFQVQTSFNQSQENNQSLTEILTAQPTNSETDQQPSLHFDRQGQAAVSIVATHITDNTYQSKTIFTYQP